MFTRPAGVQQILTGPGPGNTIQQVLIPVLPANWQEFCMKSDAETLLTEMAAVPGVQASSLAVVEYTETEALSYVFASNDPTASPRIWQILGLLDDGNTISEIAGGLIDRKTKPNYFLDNHNGVLGGGTLKYQELYGSYVSFYWGQ